MTQISADDLTEEQFEMVVNSKGFQKMLAYNKLADGIEVLEEQDEIYSSMVKSIRERHSSNLAERSVEQVLELFVDEVKTFTEPLTGAGDEDVDAGDVEDIFVDNQ